MKLMWCINHHACNAVFMHLPTALRSACRWHAQGGEAPASPSQPAQSATSQRQEQQPRKARSAWYKGTEQGSKLSASRVLSEREMELIELGGAG